MPSLVPTVVRVSVILLAVAGTAGHVAYLDALWWHTLGLTETLARDVSDATLVLLTAHAIVTVVCATLSVALVLNEGPRPGASRALGGAFGAWSYLMAYSGVTMLFRPDPGLVREVFEAHFLVVEVLGLGALMRFTALFPRRLEVDELHPLETLPAILLPFHHVAVFMRSAYAPWGVGLAVLVTLWSLVTLTGGTLSDAGLSPAMDFVRFCSAGIVVMNMRRAWSASTEGDRDALTWLLVSLAFLMGALALLVGGNVLVLVTGFPEPDVAWRPIVLDVGVIAFLVSLAMSALYKGSLDPALVTRKVATLAAVGTVGMFLAAGLEALLSGGITGRVSMRTGVGTAVAFALILATYRGLARLVERAVPV